ncbi:hypothetical protein I5H64_gp069 [Mycobacterium phage MinionDave]|uniref:Uncharacterized protein n=1 Tax=Mycobacterium phage MinionDave TaxID=2653763 RepID=A0A5Q2WK95_9CAUD|nr:hypothetical protein I5H64_gp069 [Mycobacterium phage MinionDave]QGH78854.1 hypothetical protein SEA_MINIONDAVE_69 [Mycobacterium phage MinionDave]
MQGNAPAPKDGPSPPNSPPPTKPNDSSAGTTPSPTTEHTSRNTMTCLLCDHPRSTHTPQCQVRLSVDLRDMTRYTQCLCPGFEGTEEED